MCVYKNMYVCLTRFRQGHTSCLANQPAGQSQSILHSNSYPPPPHTYEQLTSHTHVHSDICLNQPDTHTHTHSLTHSPPRWRCLLAADGHPRARNRRCVAWRRAPLSTQLSPRGDDEGGSGEGEDGDGSGVCVEGKGEGVCGCVVSRICADPTSLDLFLRISDCSSRWSCQWHKQPFKRWLAI